jgi:hypothetical protein
VKCSEDENAEPLHHLQSRTSNPWYGNCTSLSAREAAAAWESRGGQGQTPSDEESPRADNPKRKEIMLITDVSMTTSRWLRASLHLLCCFHLVMLGENRGNSGHEDGKKKLCLPKETAPIEHHVWLVTFPAYTL